MNKVFTFIFLLLAILMPAKALEISAWQEENDGEVSITFCNTLQIQNVSLDKTVVASSVILPKDEEIYENLALLKPEISQKILACFEGVCELKNTCKKVEYTLISANKIKNKNLVLAKVAFDGDISATFLVSSYQKKNKTLYRISTPKDFKFLSKKYRNKFRTWLIGETKNLL